MRALGIDFGERRIGLALSDDAGRLAVPLDTLERTNDAAALDRIAALCRREGVGRLVVGQPLNLDGSAGPAAERSARFADKLARATGLPFELVDESLTTVEATARLREAGVDPRKHRARIDAVAAQILLQEALDRRRER